MSWKKAEQKVRELEKLLEFEKQDRENETKAFEVLAFLIDFYFFSK